MPQYHFKISDKKGKVFSKSYDSSSKKDALSLIKSEGFVPIKEQNTAKGNFSFFHRRFDLLDFSENLVSLLEAGIELEQILTILQDIQEEHKTKRILQQLHQGLHEGQNMATLLRKFPNYFSEAYATMVETGEESGRLIEVLKNYNAFLASRKKAINFIISSSLYPLFIILMSGGIVAFFLFYMIPKLKDIFEQATNKSLITNILLQLANFVENYFWLLFILPFIFIGILIVLLRNYSVRRYLQEVSLKIPLISSFLITQNILFFTSSLAILLKSYIPLIKAVKLSRITIANPIIRESLVDVEADLQQGKKLSLALQRSPYITPFMIKMLAIGEETGHVDQTLQRITIKYQAEMQEKTRRALSLLEPLIIVLVGIFIGIIVISIFTAVSDATTISI